jgi:hypothetical protein
MMPLLSPLLSNGLAGLGSLGVSAGERWWSGAGSNRRPSAFQKALQVQAGPSQAARAGYTTPWPSPGVHVQRHASTAVVSTALASSVVPTVCWFVSVASVSLVCLKLDNSRV